MYYIVKVRYKKFIAVSICLKTHLKLSYLRPLGWRPLRNFIVKWKVSIEAMEAINMVIFYLLKTWFKIYESITTQSSYFLPRICFFESLFHSLAEYNIWRDQQFLEIIGSINVLFSSFLAFLYFDFCIFFLNIFTLNFFNLCMTAF